jgi:hypothetical protein
VSITAYDPAHDGEGRMLEIGLRLMEQVAGAVQARGVDAA